LTAGCGGGGSNESSTGGQTAANPSPPSAGTASASGVATQPGAGALTAEAQQTAAGDIPDNQVFLTYRDPGEGYTVKVPEGWARTGSGSRVTFRDKNNVVRIEIASGSRTTMAAARAELARAARTTPSLHVQQAKAGTAAGKPVIEVVYSTVSSPSPVTGKRVTLVVDRYYVPGAGKHAVIDLGTPQGVDNVDAYRLMIESFRWK
jgi:hypothetical protein